MTPKFTALTPELHDYIVATGAHEDAVLKRVREETAALGDVAVMQVSPDQGAFLTLLVHAIGARRALEIGTFTGYSALAVALALPADGRLVACDVSEEWTATARRYWKEAGVDARIELRLAPALQTLRELLEAGSAGSFDLIFIDADKGNYLAYYEAGLDLLRPGGLIAVDNTLWDGRVADDAVDDDDTRAIRAFNAALHDDARVDLSLVPIGDGLTLARKL